MVDKGDLKAPPEKGTASSRVEREMYHGVALDKLSGKNKRGLPWQASAPSRKGEYEFESRSRQDLFLYNMANGNRL
jgi:hypothetical protein